MKRAGKECGQRRKTARKLLLGWEGGQLEGLRRRAAWRVVRLGAGCEVHVDPLSRSPLINSLTRSLLPFPPARATFQNGWTALRLAKENYYDSEETKAGKPDCAALLEAAM